MEYLRLGVYLMCLFHVSNAIEFSWSIGKEGRCIANDTMLGLCSKKRDIQCIMKHNNEPVPNYYCSGIAEKPASYVNCASKDCSQRCIMSTWSKWHMCDPACVVSFKYRTRSILWRTNSDDKCPSLIEKVTCAHCKNMTDHGTYLWQVDDWGACKEFTTTVMFQSGTTTPATSSSSGSLCGARIKLGKMTRTVSCVDSKKGQIIATDKCMNSKDKFGRITQRPDVNKVCQVPCDCHMSTWTAWSTCPRDCSVTEKYRTRDVLYAAQMGGKPCGDLVEKQPCSSQACGATQWYGTPWGTCRTQDLPGSRDQPLVCGHGYQTRHRVYCMRSVGNDMVPVSDENCDAHSRLPLKRPCMVPCPSKCMVSEWQPWEPCSVSCGGEGKKKRIRSILKPASEGGQACPHLVEQSRCGYDYCIKYHAFSWNDCLKVGFKSRPVYCKTPWRYVGSKNCLHLVKPATKMNCTYGHSDDCALSHWSDWTSCSKSCGIEGGIETRYRTVLAYPKQGRPTCPKPDQLIETRKCNVFTFCQSDSTITWQTQPWSACVASVKGKCGDAVVGYRQRTLTCRSLNDTVLDETLCAAIPKPVIREACNISCEKDCSFTTWGVWSKCLHATCETNGIQVRRRYVRVKPTSGGQACPPNTNNDAQTEIRQCSSHSPCGQYQWLPSDWSICTMLRPADKCGAGYQTRDITCQQSDGKTVAPSYCYKSLLTPAPRVLKECWKPCAQSCVRTAWLPHSTCPLTCTQGKPPVYRQMNRIVVDLNPARGGFSTTCPDRSAKDMLSEKELCPSLPCLTFKWRVGAWLTCILDVNQCGRGKKAREVVCERNDGVIVSDTYCQNLTKPSNWKKCSMICNENCIVSNWNTWSECTQPCGDSIQIRNRTVVSPKLGLGADCPVLTESRLCHGTPCILYKWNVSLWSTCEPTTKNALCGTGSQTRTVVCYPDKNREDVCLRQSPKPSTSQHCSLPCPGDCVWGNWGAWTPCERDFGGCAKDRYRSIVREADPNTGKKCNTKREDTISCKCPQMGKWSLGSWTSCQLDVTKDMVCGTGMQYRSRQCIGSNNEVLDDSYCSKTKPTTSQKCTIDCPIGCVLSAWNTWSECSEQCGSGRIQNRTRTVLVPSSNGGEMCPDESGMVQTKPCRTKPCGGYTLDQGVWSKCHLDGEGCGYGIKRKEVICRGTQGLPVQLYHCLNNTESESTPLERLQLLRAVLNNATEYLVTLKQTCYDPCPGNCVYTEWSEWSQCGRSCLAKSKQSNQTRTRIIITPASMGGKACPSTLFESKRCQNSGACIGVDWKASPWYGNGTRDVWCATTTGIRVSEACNSKTKPSQSKTCSPSCKDGNSYCQDGVCICTPSYDVFQDECVPMNGCVRDQHCVYSNTACINEKCQCKRGYAMNVTTGDCQWLPVEIQSTIAATMVTHDGNVDASHESSTKTTTENDDVKKEAVEKEATTDYMKWIGISIGVLMFCILLVIGVFCYTRKYKKAKKKKYNPERPKSIELIGLQARRSMIADNHHPTKV